MVTAASPKPLAERPIGQTVATAIVSAAIGLALALLALCLAPTPSLRIDGAQFQVREGTGKVVGGALEVASPAPNGQVVLVISLPDLPAYRYASVAFRATGLEGSSAPSVFWIARAAPRDAHPKPLSADEIRAGSVTLAADERWRGDMMTLGFVAQGPLRAPIRLEQVEVVPGPLGWDEALSVLLRNVFNVESWSGGSVNFHVGALRSERRLTPVVLVALWVACTLLVHAAANRLLARAAPRPPGALVLLVALLLGIAVLDLRWQFDLLHRARQTLVAGGLPPDADAQHAISEMRASIQTPDARVIVVSDDPIAYATHRARYHLLPLRSSFGIDRLPTTAQTKPGDYLLLLSYRGAIRFDATAGVLATPETTLQVELLVRSSAAGALFRIKPAS